MAHYEIKAQDGASGHDPMTGADVDVAPSLLIFKDGELFHEEDYLEHAVRFVLELAVNPGDRISMDITF